MKRTSVDDSDDKYSEQRADENKHKKPNEWHDGEVNFFEQQLKEANEGLVSSQHLVGHCYMLGFGTIPNLKTAIEWYQKAADQSHLESCFELALLFDKGFGVEKNPKIALEWYDKAVSMLPPSLDQTSNHLLYFIGVLYFNGLAGYEKNLKKAMKYLTKSANQMNDNNRVEYYGSLRSMTNIGDKWKNGNDYSQAKEWYVKSAELGEPYALSRIGNLYYTGSGVEQNYKKAMECFLKSAEYGNAAAMCEIGRLYNKGEGVQKNYKTALEWFEKSAGLGNKKAMCDIGMNLCNGFGLEQNYKKAFEWFLKSAEMGYRSAMYNMGVMYQHNLGVEKDYKKALEWYLKVAKKNHSLAMYQIGNMYWLGKGMESDDNKAIAWHLKSAKLGNGGSMKELSEIYYKQKKYLDASIWLDRYYNRGILIVGYSMMERPIENFGRNIIQVDNVENINDDTVEYKTFIIRFIEGDMKVNGKILNRIPFFQTMTNEMWMQGHEEEDGFTVLNLSSIQNGESPLEMSLLDTYLKVKQDESTVFRLDSLPWIQLFNLARFFTDTHVMKNIIEKVGLIERWYLLNDIHLFTSTDLKILELYLLENIQDTHNLPLEIIQSLQKEDGIHRDTKMKIILERQTQQTMECDLEGIRQLLIQPRTCFDIIPKQYLSQMEGSVHITEVMNCVFEVNIKNNTVTVTIGKYKTRNLIQVYLQTHFMRPLDDTRYKAEGHLLSVEKNILLTLVSPFEKNECFSVGFSGFFTSKRY